MARSVSKTVETLTVVTPLQQTTTIFRVIFGWLINREHEVFGSRLLVGIAMSLIGASVLSYSLYAS